MLLIALKIFFCEYMCPYSGNSLYDCHCVFKFHKGTLLFVGYMLEDFFSL